MKENRHSILNEILNKESCFKMICGAGNEDAPYVKKLALVYTLAGAKILDISANVDVVKHASEGIDLAFKLSKKLNLEIEVDGGINFENNKIVIKAGANILVSGTTIFKENKGNIKKNIDCYTN